MTAMIVLQNQKTGEVVEVPAGAGIEGYRQLDPDRPGMHLWEQVHRATPHDGRSAHERFAQGDAQ